MIKLKLYPVIKLQPLFRIIRGVREKSHDSKYSKYASPKHSS
jgi:hypothetical protein